MNFDVNTRFLFPQSPLINEDTLDVAVRIFKKQTADNCHPPPR
ncbi:MAG: hypothetical protein WDM76_07915 [Limisphaerales bacterium]